MKILQINCVFQKGSTGKIVNDIHTGLVEEGYESYVFYGRGKLCKTDPQVQKICSEFYANVNHFWSRITGVLYGGCYFSTWHIINMIKKLQPDIVHLHCINGYFTNIYRLLTWLGKRKIKTVVTQHAEFFYTGGCGYTFECEKWRSDPGCGHCPRLKEETQSFYFDRTQMMWKHMKRAWDEFDNENLTVVSVSPWLDFRTSISPILKDKNHNIVLNGVDTENIFEPCYEPKLKNELCPNGEKLILHVTPNFSLDPEHNKGGCYVMQLAHRMEGLPVKFVVVGNSNNEQNTENVVFAGRITDQKLLAKYYSCADITLLTSKCETFSMVCAESLCCGTPIVGFLAGAPEMISIPEYSRFVPYGDLEALQAAIEATLSQGKSEAISLKAEKKYNRQNMIKGYEDIYKGLIEKGL